MTNPVITYYPTSGYTIPVYPVYNDQTFLVTAASDTRYSYKLLSDVIINGEDVATLKNYPFNGIIEVNPQGITQNYLLHDFNYNTAPISDNPDSIKSVYSVLGEEFSRTLAFSSITIGSSYTVLNGSMATLLQGFDRVQVTINGQTTFGRVDFTIGSQVLTDIPYSFWNTISGGTAIEGVEYFDCSSFQFITTNPHNFNVGDRLFLQMDTWATGKIKLNSGSSGQVTQISIGGMNLLASPVSYSTSISTTLDLLVSAINSGGNTSGYTSYHHTGSNVLHLYSTRFNSDSTVGLPIVITSTGSLSFTQDAAMFKLQGYDTLGQGWNPQLSGQWTVASVPSSTSFTTVEPISSYFNNDTGSERGTWYSFDNYVFSGEVTGTTSYVMNNSNFYNYPTYQNEIAKHSFKTHTSTNNQGIFLTNKPRTSFEYYSINDIETVDLLFNGATTVGTSQILSVNTYTGNGTFHNNYLIDLHYLLSGFTGNVWKKFSFGVGAWNLNHVSSLSNATVVGDNITSYEIQLLAYTGGTPTTFSEPLTFNQNCTGNAFKYYQLIFLNKWGSFDYFTLNANYDNSLNVQRTQFDRKRESVLNQTNYGINTQNRGKTDFYINSSKTKKLYTNWLTLEESEWLSEVFESPQVYLYCPDDNTTGIDFTNLYPVNITDSDIKLFNERSRMRQFEFTVIVSNTRINQKN